MTDTLDDIYARLRRDTKLGPARTSILLGQAKCLYEQKHPEATAGAIRAQKANLAMGHNVDDNLSPTFSQEVAQRTAMHIRKVQRFLEWGTRIATDVLEALDGEKWDRGAFLAELAGIDRAYQMQRLRMWQGEKPEPPPAPPRLSSGWWEEVAGYIATEDRFLVPGMVDLRCGDTKLILPTLVGQAGAVITDNPYGIGYVDGYDRSIRDDQDPEEIAGWSVPLMAECLKPDSYMALFGRWDVSDVWRRHMAENGVPQRQQGVWDKTIPNGRGDTASTLMSRHEDIYIGHKGLPRLHVWTDAYGFTATPGKRVQRDVGLWSIQAPRGTGLDTRHPSSKPPELGMRLMLNLSAPGDMVLDPFMGCGPFAVAAVRTGRSYVGIEFEHEYFEVAVRRVQEALLEHVPAMELAA